MNDAERRELNKRLHAQGERICKDCEQQLALSEFSSYVDNGNRYWLSTCNACRNAQRRGERQPSADPDYFEGCDVVLPDDYEGAWFTAKELRAKNEELAKHGRRICAKHQGAALPLDNEHFPYKNRADGLFGNECKACKRLRSNARNAALRSDPETAAKIRAQNNEACQRYRKKNLALVRARDRIRQREKQRGRRYRRRLERFAQIIGRAS